MLLEFIRTHKHYFSNMARSVISNLLMSHKATFQSIDSSLFFLGLLSTNQSPYCHSGHQQANTCDSHDLRTADSAVHLAGTIIPEPFSSSKIIILPQQWCFLQCLATNRITKTHKQTREGMGQNPEFLQNNGQMQVILLSAMDGSYRNWIQFVE